MVDWATVRDDLLIEIARRFGTPTYVYDMGQVSARAAELRRALPQADLRYAVKANPNGAILRKLSGLGFGAEAITLGELERATRAGVPPERIVVGGPGQDETLIGRSLELGVGLVSLDSSSQWRLWEGMLARKGDHRVPRFLVRINPQLDPQTHPHLATGSADSKFGVPPEEGLELAGMLAAANLLAGFHFHVGSQITSLEVYRTLSEVVDHVYRAYPQSDLIDLGGGFAVPGFPLAEFAELANELASRHGLGLILEPGRYLVAEAGLLLTRVRHVKDGPLRHVIADAGMAELLRPALYSARHPVRRLHDDARGADAASEADLDGPLCENADRLAPAVELPESLAPGDLLAVEQAGAYGMAMASNYASSLRPAEVAVDDGEARLVRARETVDDLLRLELA